MNEKDLEECLRAINPVDEGQVRPREDTLVGILEHAAAVGDRRGRISSFGPPRTRRRIAAVVLAAVVLAATTAAVFAMTRRPTTSPLSVGCYDRLDQNADTAVFDTVGQDLSPAAICARGWQSAFGEPAPQMLVTCVVSAGGTGVFPNEAGLSPEEACASISASVPSGGSPYGGLSADQVRLLAADLEHRFAGILDRPECAGQVGLKAEVQAALLEYANATWTIVDSTSATQEWTFPDGASALVPVPTTAEGQHCAGYAIDAVGAKVILVNSWPELPGTVPKD